MITTHADSLRMKEASAKNEPDTAAKGPRFYAFQKKVQLGETVGPNVVIKGGIDDGDKLVVDGVQLLHDGSRIAVGSKPASKEGGKDDGSKTEGNKKD